MNMFGQTRRRLTMFYSLMMFFFLLLLVFGMHESMEWSITSEQEREVLDTTEDVLNEEIILLQRHGSLEDDSEDYKASNGNLYFYAFDNHGKLINYSRAVPVLEPLILEAIQKWNVPDNQIMEFTNTHNFKYEYKVLMAAKPIVIDGENRGMVYVGKDVASVYNGLRKATLILGLLSLLAFIVANFAGHIMAGKAIIPLKEAYERQRQFAADASHELRTPLSVVMASVDVLGNDASIASPFLQQVIVDMRDEVKKMTKLVSDLLLVARSENQTFKLVTEKFDLIEAIHEIVRKMQPLADEKHINLFFVKQESVIIRADIQRIKQLLIILIDNALKYTPGNGVVTVKVDGEFEKNKIRIMVRDTGIGISLTDQHKVFDRFYRVDRARSRDSGGNGLGLAIARDIVNLHDGELYIESKIGEGAAFIVELKK
ncbi:His Kinase A (phospho-acceptor) domain-containing protein [Propionispira arboris]|uniref:histidine kinase n=2 Tax=Propionispira arboris TaxID=84035 RepID=A0A1H7B0Y5_9FIRM|nr:His Kinase A (phospho-acceptor) domain-containing protein [Propionispira arboris]